MVTFIVDFPVPLGISEYRRDTAAQFALPRGNAIEAIKVKAFTGGTKEMIVYWTIEVRGYIELSI